MNTQDALTLEDHRIVAWIKRHRSVLLAIAFIAQILASPLADRDPHAGAVLALILLAILIVGISYQVNRKVAYRALAPFCLLWFVARMLEAFAGPDHIYSHLAPAAGLGLSCAALFIIFHRFFLREHGDSRHAGRGACLLSDHCHRLFSNLCAAEPNGRSPIQ